MFSLYCFGVFFAFFGVLFGIFFNMFLSILLLSCFSLFFVDFALCLLCVLLFAGRLVLGMSQSPKAVWW